MTRLFSQKNRGNSLIVRHSSKSLVHFSVIIFFFIVLLPKVVVAQSANNFERISIMHLNQFLSALPVNNAETLRVKSLLKDVHPAIYLGGGQVRSYGTEPVSLFTEVNAVNLTASVAELQRQTIEIVTINIDNVAELDGNIDMSMFSVFPNLKYVYIISSVETTPQKITNLLSEINPKFKVFYNIRKSS